MVCGVLSCALVAYISTREKFLDEEGHPVHLAISMMSYFPWLLWQVLLANLDVAYRVWHPKLKINPRFIRVPYRIETDLGITTYANSITLTPGTVTVSVDKENQELQVHALTDEAAVSLLSGKMHDRVKKFEEKA